VGTHRFPVRLSALETALLKHVASTPVDLYVVFVVERVVFFCFGSFNKTK